MAEPSIKSEGIEEFLTEVTGVDRRAQIRADKCTWCKGEAREFRNNISRREYEISGFCQKCQDDTFGVD